MPQGVSLHIGLNSVDPDHYAGWSGPLVACEADALDMQAIAKSAGFQTSLMLTAQATRDAVLGGIRVASDILAPGDIFLLTNSSHGSQVPDVNGDEGDRQDETWCLFDGQLIDDELYFALTSFAAGVRIVVTCDSCHSGTVARTPFMKSLYGDMFKHALVTSGIVERLGLTSGDIANDLLTAARPRAMPPEVALRTYQQHKAFYDGLNRPAIRTARSDVRASGVLLGGCQDNQLAMDGTFNGAFTEKLKQVWNGGAFRGRYRAFLTAIRGEMPATQSPSYFPFGTPVPVLEGRPPFLI